MTITLFGLNFDYKLIHILGAIAIISGLVFVAVCNHFTKKPPIKLRLFGSILHGLGMTSSILSGLYILKSHPQFSSSIYGEWPLWAKYKIFIWLLLGLSISLAKRNSKHLFLNILVFLFLAGAAIHLALAKPI
jgi:hypothetical protein